MMPLLSPARLADSFTLTPATSADLADVYDLVVAETTAVLGYCPDTEVDVRSWLEAPPEASSMQVLVHRKGTGGLAQWWGALRGPGEPRFEVWVRTHSDVSRADGDELTWAAWEAIVAWVRDIGGEDRTDEVLVHSGCVTGDDSAFRRLLEAGFVHERTFWEMSGRVPDAATALEGAAVGAEDSAGVTIRPADDQATVHRLLMEGFAEHWGFEATSFDDWVAAERSMAGYDPDLWVLAEMGSIPVAAMIMSRRSAADKGLYVQELTTLKPYRHQGAASALLRHAFDLARTAGYNHVVLHVDSDNADGAPAIYHRAGLDVRHAFNACVLRLAPQPRPAPRGAGE